MEPELTLKFCDRYLKNQRRLWYTFLPSSRKKVRNNRDSALKGIERYEKEKDNTLSFIKEGLKKRLDLYTINFFNNAPDFQELIGIVVKINERKMNREEYVQLSHDLRHKKWAKELNPLDFLKHFRDTNYLED